MIKKLLRKIRTEKGQALPMVLILMAVGGLIVAPLLSYTSSGLKVGKAYEKMADEYYAADAGIEDGLWQIKYNNLEELFSDYQRYRFNHEYPYPLSYPVEVNDIPVDITIENVWIPKDIAAPDNDEASSLIGAGKLIIAGGVPAELTQQVRIYYYKGATDPTLYVNEIGVWLPPGFSYNAEGECTLETWLNNADPPVDCTPSITDHCGGEAVVWTLAEPLPFTALPGVSETDTPMTSVFTFNFLPNDPESERSPEAVSWITTSGVTDIPYTWDADIRVFHINSQAGGEDGTTIDAYAIKTDLRQLVTGRNGDYRAIGNTLMENRNPDWGAPVRDYLLPDSDATAEDIPENAQVESAFLYWSGWIEEASTTLLWSDSCSSFNNWTRVGSGTPLSYDWNTDFMGRFQGRHTSGTLPDTRRTLTMTNSLNLSSYYGQTVEISWDQTKSGTLLPGDAFYYAFYNSITGWSANFVAFQGNSTPTNPFSVPIPQEYLTSNFTMQFYFNFTGTYKYVYVDNIKIEAQLEPETIADTEVRFEIDGDQVYLADDEYGNPTVPTEGSQSIYANNWTALENEGSGGYSYSCKADVTALVQEFTEQGNATYTVGDVHGDIGSQWSYAGWSLIIIYSSPETQRHQLYLFDDFLYIAPNTDGLSFPISGFLVPDPIPGEQTAATITCFVGDGDDYYSGDFIAINAPPELLGYQIPNSYKLWDGITLPASPSWPLPRMSNTSGSPNNVWNGRSEGLGGSFIDGVDIDTFDVPWGDPLSSGLLKPGDSSAEIVLNYADPNPTYAELINFIYIIISFRSSTVTGGTVTYLIEG
jgi:hypothetical protein